MLHHTQLYFLSAFLHRLQSSRPTEQLYRTTETKEKIDMTGERHNALSKFCTGVIGEDGNGQVCHISFSPAENISCYSRSGKEFTAQSHVLNTPPAFPVDL